MEADSKIFVCGARGMVGSALIRQLQLEGHNNLITRSSKELDLRNQQAVEKFFAEEKPEYVFLSAAHVGGILANNKYRADFIYDNLMIEANVIHQCYVAKVKKLMFFGSSCIYPKLAPQPLKEDYLLTGLLEPTNEPYAIAKIAGIKLCEAYHDQYGCNFISVMPTNLYGQNDNYDLNTSHVIPALIRKFHEAAKSKSATVSIWGTGSPKREFLHVDDLARASVLLMKTYNDKQFINIGYGEDISIKDLVLMIKDVSGFQGAIDWDTTKPDGTPRKLMDVSRLQALGFKPSISLREGLTRVYAEYAKNNGR